MKKNGVILFFVLISSISFAEAKKDSVDLMKGNRSSIYFGGSLNYLFPDGHTSLYPEKFTLRAGGDLMYYYRINRFSQLSVGLTLNQFHAESSGTSIGYWVRTSDYRLIGIPFFYSLEMPIPKKIFASIYSGILFTRLIYNERTSLQDNGTLYSRSDYNNGSMSLFLSSGFHLNFVLSQKIILKTGLEFYYYHFNPFESSFGPPAGRGAIHFIRFSTGLNIRF